MDEYHNHKKLRIIGDVHGGSGERRAAYVKLCKEANAKGLHTLQVGDLGFYYDYNRMLYGPGDTIDISHNKFFMGNHDGYNWAKEIHELDYCLGDYGLRTINGVTFYFVRGAFSIDKKRGLIGVDWFPEEELEPRQFDAVIEDYVRCKPDIMITHDCPDSVGHDGWNALKDPEILKEWGFEPVNFTTHTQVLLQQLFNQHKPKQWFFGHYHKNWESEVKGTKFRCIAPLDYVDI